MSRDGRYRAERRGRLAEDLSALWLRLCGWHLLDRRLRTPRGEIDLVMRRRGVVAFVEVKWREDAAALDMAIDARRLARVAAAAEAVSHRYARRGDIVRIDVLMLAPWRWPRHIVNAWQP